MDSSPEMERFGISDADYEYMMDPTRRRFKQSRKQTIYGVFASDDSASEDEKSGFGGRDTSLKRKGANYSAPITFVSGGVKVGGKDEDEKMDTSVNDVQISDEEDDQHLASHRDSDSDSSVEKQRFSKPRRQPSLSVGAGRRAAVAAAASKSNTGGFGAWERHTRGIGMKLLEQMGYQPGKGLGSSGQGITTPVLATLRSGKGSVGFLGPESVPAPVKGSDVTESTAVDKPDESSGPDAESKRLEQRREGRLFDCPALRHNLGLILRSCENEIRKLDRTARFEEDHSVALEHEIEKLVESVKTESVEVERLRKALELIAQFESDMIQKDGGLSPDEIASWMARIREECADLPELPVLMAAMARPMLDGSLAKWKPLSEPGYCFQLLSKWRDFFQNNSAFDVILETSWLSTIRRTIVNDWDPRDCEPLLQVLEIWGSVLPDDLLEHRILDELVLPKLQEAVSIWNPLTDTIPIHTWLHPWLPWFGGAERLANIHDTVLQKLSTCLADWHPSDGSAHSVLTPWRSVVSIGAMSAFLNRHIVPKLGLALQQFKLNPASQNMDAWTWVMRWADLIGPAVLVNLLEQHFWPRWITVLANWLSQGVEARQRGDHQSAAQVYQEVGRWYAGWKGQVPPECMEYASVKDALTKALAMMERAMRGLPPQEPKPATIIDSSRCTSAGVTASRNGTPATPLVAPPPPTLRKQVEQVAAQRGLAFHPIPNRMFEGQQVYRLGQLHVFFDRNVSFLFNPTNGGWHPVSFAELMSKAEY
ncbi:tuftelin-interacting protein 11 [Paragonimus westermani]|uniref:Tuftelin-interacting protein 11 n=1 Tax=Paragonimus westermani TaxID=34504 RepID=A0A5J4P3C1_9TREM|nr:tuftelin-interacting protein 11 [Paragonimus westermani]